MTCHMTVVTCITCTCITSARLVVKRMHVEVWAPACSAFTAHIAATSRLQGGIWSWAEGLKCIRAVRFVRQWPDMEELGR